MEDRLFTVTLGQGDTDKVWTDQRSLTWTQVCQLLTDHREGPKRGSCLVPARFRGTRRHKADADEIALAVLDSDCGHTLAEIETAVRTRGWAAIVHSTHSHLTTRTRAAKAAWEKFRAECPIEAADFYLRHKGYLPRVTAGAAVVEDTGREVTFAHPPVPKFRLVLPLATPWCASNYPNQEAANTAWKERIEALAAALGLHHDQSCTDTSRLFYLPRHAPGAEFETLVIEGTSCDIWNLPAAIQAPSPEHKPALTLGAEDRLEIAAVNGPRIDLVRWAAQHAGRFQIVTALRARAPGIFTGPIADGNKHHIRCANEDHHSAPGPDGATFIVNAGDADTGAFVYHCRHAHCDGQDRLYFLGRMLERGWLQVEDLTNPVFLRDTASPGPVPTYDELVEQAKGFSATTRPEVINALLVGMVKAALNPIAQRGVFVAVREATHLPLGALQEGLRAAEAELRGPAVDLGLKVAKLTLARFFDGGDHLIRSIDKCFWAYTGTHWRRLTDEQVLNRILAVVETTVDPLDIDFRTVTSAAFTLLTALRALDGDVLRLTEEPPPVINCRNGELWIAEDGSVTLRPHRFDSYLTYVLDVSYIPGARCPRFDQALLDIFAEATYPDPTDPDGQRRICDAAAVARHFNEFLGYTIQPRRDIACYFMLRGGGNNGKTKLVQTIERLINKRAIYSDRLANIEQDKFAIGSLAGKLILLDDDVDTGTRIPDGFLKKVSERKVLTGQLKFKDSFEFVATCVPVMLANNYPLCADLSLGQRRRAKIIPFDHTFTKADQDDALFPYIWNQEMPGVLNRAIEGLQRLRQRGGFDEPESCIRARREWLAAANPLVTFITELCTDDRTAQVPLKAFYERFREWAEESGVKSVLARNTLKANLINLGYTVRHTKSGSTVFGLALFGSYFAADPDDLDALAA
ncbi:MAG: hypothetical protein HQL37_09935 [Alphaproteobacteria bacterium]|nr:hypothetical protein [Alphaproteobacteria bacterium]